MISIWSSLQDFMASSCVGWSPNEVYVVARCTCKIWGNLLPVLEVSMIMIMYINAMVLHQFEVCSVHSLGTSKPASSAFGAIEYYSDRSCMVILYTVVSWIQVLENTVHLSLIQWLWQHLLHKIPLILLPLIYCHYFSCCRIPSLCLLSLVVSITPFQSVMQLMTCCRPLTQIITTAYLVCLTHQCELSPSFLLNLSLTHCILSAR